MRAVSVEPRSWITSPGRRRLVSGRQTKAKQLDQSVMHPSRRLRLWPLCLWMASKDFHGWESARARDQINEFPRSPFSHTHTYIHHETTAKPPMQHSSRRVTLCFAFASSVKLGCCVTLQCLRRVAANAFSVDHDDHEDHPELSILPIEST